MREKFWMFVIKAGDAVICSFWNTLERVTIWLRKIRAKRMKLSIKGEYAREYYRSIRDGEWTEKDRISEYEKAIEDGIRGMKEDGYDISREEVAGDLYEVLGWMG